MTRALPGLVLAALLAQGCSRAHDPPVAAARTPGADHVLDDLEILGTGTLRSGRRSGQDLGHGTGQSSGQSIGQSTGQSIDQHIDSLLADPGFSRNVAPLLLLGEQSTPSPYMPGPDYVLHLRWDNVYYLRRPCRRKQAVEVHPWWKLASTVWVCPDSYEPTHLVDSPAGTPEGAAGRYCGSQVLRPADSSYCGCGPNLVFCYRDPAQLKEVQKSMQKEVFATIDRLVQTDAPLASVFTTNETFRDANVELLYVRSRVMNGDPDAAAAIAALAQWPAGGKLAPRHEATPGQHAGILTTPHMLYFRDNPRDRLQSYYQKLWCSGPPNNGMVTAGVVLALGTGNVRVGKGSERNQAWRELAARPVCTDCHARMDYGAQFFAGYPEVRVAPFFLARESLPGTGPLYNLDIRDLRGEGPLTPRGFAELALSQKEFESCMVKNVAKHVFSDLATPDDLSAIRDRFREEPTLRAMMRVAVRRYHDRMVSPHPAGGAMALIAAGASRDATPAGSAAVRVSGELRTALERFCLDCHDSAPRDFSGEELSREVIANMLTQVAFGTMPKRASGMSPSERRRLAEQLLFAEWPGGEQRKSATAYFLSRMRALPTHSLPALLRVIRGDDQGHDGQLGPSPYLLAVTPDLMQLGPGVAAIAAMEALKACQAAINDDKDGGRLEACLTKKLAWRDLVYGRPGE